MLVAGAGGSIGGAVCRELARTHAVIALVGSELRVRPADWPAQIELRSCEAFSRRNVEDATAGCDYIVYLVHTRVRTSRLDQAESEDMDVLVADNVARAARRNGVRQIVYLGGVIPPAEPARARARRSEVLQALSAYGTPVTTLRAGLVVSPGSSAVNLLAVTATRLPIVLLPAWAATRRQPIAVGDVIRAIRYCLGNPDTYDRAFDIGGPVVLGQRELMRRAAAILNRPQLILTVPFFPEWLYRGYLKLLAPRAHPDLIRRAVANLRHDILVSDNPVQRYVADGAVPAREVVEAELQRSGGRLPANPRDPFARRYLAGLKARRAVRSIQRIELPRGHNAAWVADHYFRWLARFTWPFVRCDVDAEGSCRVGLRLPRVSLLELRFRPDESSSDRRLYAIAGGLLARGQVEGRPRLEFRDVLDGRWSIVAIHDFAPQLPWVLYRATQATIHLVVMRAFQRHMARIAAGTAD